MNIYSFASILASLFCLALGIFTFARKPDDRKCRLFGIGSIVSGLWTSFPFVVSRASNETAALFFARVAYIPAIFTASAWLHFMLTLAKEKWLKFEKMILILSYSFSGLLLLFIFSPFFIKGVNRFAPHFSVVPGPIFIFFVIIFGLIFLYGIRALFCAFRITGGYKRNQLKFILLASVFGFLGAILHFGAAYLNKEPFPHDFLIIGYTGLVAYSIVKYRLMDIEIAITRTGIFVAVYTLVLGFPFAVVAWLKDSLEKTWGENWWLFPALILVISATVGPFIYIYFERKAERRLLYEQHRYQQTLRQAAREMARIRNLKKLLNLIVHTVTKTVRIFYSGIYLFEEQSDQFILEAGRNIKKTQPVSIDKKDPLINWLKERNEPLVYDEIGRKAQEQPRPILNKLVDRMHFLNATVIVPGFLEDRLVGFLVLGDKRSGKIYSTEDLNTFSLLANQAALAIENASLYENIEEQVRQRTKELVEVQKQLIQAEKLATVGTLAGGVAHEINNPLTAILTNAQMLLATATQLDPDSQESLELIEEATKRCRTIVQKLMTYAKKPLEAAEVSEVDVLDIVKKVVSFLGYQLEQENIKTIIDAEKDKYLAIGNPNEFEQVVTNIILNAKDAIRQLKKTGSIQVSLSKGDDWIKIAIKDDGIGIAKEITPKIFDPFFTTKDVGKGTGLGLSICQSIVEKHKGFIAVQSEPNKGSVFTVKLLRVGRKGASNGQEYFGNR